MRLIVHFPESVAADREKGRTGGLGFRPPSRRGRDTGLASALQRQFSYMTIQFSSSAHVMLRRGSHLGRTLTPEGGSMLL